uniref:G_PROTEIN_RECEP_F1_2 domain-containing protein n=1 Tax=Panagrellus redivivus TaxID=6233 RepID=A0A7E4ZXE9_PANRE
MVHWVALVPLLTLIDGIYGAVECSEESFYNNNCTLTAYNEYAILFPGFDQKLQFLPAVIAALVAIIGNVIVLVIMIVCAKRPLSRAPTEDELEELQEDEDELEAKNKSFLKKLKRKTPKGKKGKKAKGTMQDFVLSNDAVKKEAEDVQTAPMAAPIESNGQSVTATA